jgi:transcriptional regulator with XRE-family HTH domain
MTFSMKLDRLMQDRVQARTAKRAGVSGAAISSYIRGQYGPRAGTAMRLARALNVSFEWLMDDSQDWPPVWSNRPEKDDELARASAA